MLLLQQFANIFVLTFSVMVLTITAIGLTISIKEIYRNEKT